MGKNIGGCKVRKKDLYVVGYDFDGEFVYGMDGGLHRPMPCGPMNAREAKQALKCSDKNALIYKLVPVSPEDI